MAYHFAPGVEGEVRGQDRGLTMSNISVRGEYPRQFLAVTQRTALDALKASGLVRRYWVEGGNLLVEFAPAAFGGLGGIDHGLSRDAR